jgi:predicted alpha/beta hydrolase
VALLGHSLGGQLGAFLLADRPDLVTRLVTVASGLNHADSWVGATRALRHVQTQAAVALSRALGWFPGRSVGFAGRQARTEMADWGRVGLTGRYALAGIDEDLHASLARVSAPVDGFLVPEDDWTPPRSFEGLCALMPAARCRTHRLDGLPPSCRGHFRWAGAPAIVARAVAALLAEPAPG